jgi:hypothetical protein
VCGLHIDVSVHPALAERNDVIYVEIADYQLVTDATAPAMHDVDRIGINILYELTKLSCAAASGCDTRFQSVLRKIALPVRLIIEAIGLSARGASTAVVHVCA